MKYYSTITSFFIMSFFTIICLLYLGNISRVLEKENTILKTKINFMKDQVNINELEYSLFNNYNYLKKLQKIYFDTQEAESFDNRLSFYDLKNKNLENIYNVGIR